MCCRLEVIVKTVKLPKFGAWWLFPNCWTLGWKDYFDESGLVWAHWWAGRFELKHGYYRPMFAKIIMVDWNYVQKLTNPGCDGYNVGIWWLRLKSKVHDNKLCCLTHLSCSTFCREALERVKTIKSDPHMYWNQNVVGMIREQPSLFCVWSLSVSQVALQRHSFNASCNFLLK